METIGISMQLRTAAQQYGVKAAEAKKLRLPEGEAFFRDQERRHRQAADILDAE